MHVVPLIEPGRPLPKAAVYPFQLGSTTLSACEYAVDVWHFPHWQERLEIDFERQDSAISARVTGGGETVLEMSATGAGGHPAPRPIRASWTTAPPT